MKKLPLLMVAAVGAAPSLMAQASSKPNLLVIHTDEHSFRTISCYQELMSEDQAFVWGKGVNVTTPNIDRLAKEGAIYTRYYCASPVSTPSRASLVSGLYPQRTGAPKNGLHLRQDIPTFATVLAENGYSTSYVGKWHLAGDVKYTFDIEYKAGFNDNRYMMSGGHSPYFYVAKDGSVKSLQEWEYDDYPEKDVVHLTDYFTEKAMSIIERDKDKPFCLMLSIPDPHTPDFARPPYKFMFDEMIPKPPYTMSAEVAAKRPNWGKGDERKDKNEVDAFYPNRIRQYFGMVKHIDDCVGQIFDLLERENLYDNTIIVFTADHGDLFYEHKRSNKGKPYEASAKIPYVIRYPAKIKAGKVIEEASVNVDFAPTMLGLMGVETDSQFDGEDRSELLTSKKRHIVTDRTIYFSCNNGQQAVGVEGIYKLVLSKSDEPWLFDLERDPDEIENMYNQPGYEDVSKRLLKELLKQAVQFEDPGIYNDGGAPYIVNKMN